MADPLKIIVLDGDQTGQELLEQAIRVLDPDVTITIQGGVFAGPQRIFSGRGKVRLSQPGPVSDPPPDLRGGPAARLLLPGDRRGGRPARRRHRRPRHHLDRRRPVRLHRARPGLLLESGGARPQLTYVLQADYNDIAEEASPRGTLIGSKMFCASARFCALRAAE